MAPVIFFHKTITQMKKQSQLPEYVTPEEFLQLPLSQAIPFVIQDVKRFTKAGVKIDTDDWAVSDSEGKPCSVCPGGAAVLGFYNGELPELVKDRITSSGYRSYAAGSIDVIGIDKGRYASIFYIVATTFNYVRNCDYIIALRSWLTNGRERQKFIDNTELNTVLYDLYVKHTEVCGRLSSLEIKRLCKQMTELATVLEKYGY